MSNESGGLNASRQLDALAGGLFGDCLGAFHAFQGLTELSEDMRILSLNAELAAGRAGTGGVAVRALTQYTRQLVSHLNRLQGEMIALKSKVHGISAQTMRDLNELSLLRHSLRLTHAHDATADPVLKQENRTILRDAERAMVKESGELMGQMLSYTHDLAGYAARIRQVAEQSAGIATNIAIEAAGAGRHEPEFRTVSDTLKTYIKALEGMVENAYHAVRRADEGGRVLAGRLSRGDAG